MHAPSLCKLARWLWCCSSCTAAVCTAAVCSAALALVHLARAPLRLSLLCGLQVLILDWDVHHGNGTQVWGLDCAACWLTSCTCQWELLSCQHGAAVPPQGRLLLRHCSSDCCPPAAVQDLFYDDPSVLLIDLHQEHVWPGSGALDETGAGAHSRAAWRARAARRIHIALLPGAAVSPCPCCAAAHRLMRLPAACLGPITMALTPPLLLRSGSGHHHQCATALVQRARCLPACFRAHRGPRCAPLCS